MALRRPASLDRARNRLIAVREDHEPATLERHGEAENALVAIDLGERRGRRSSPRAPTSTPRRGSRPDGTQPRLARAGTTRTCPGTARSCGVADARRATARSADAADRRRQPVRLDLPAALVARRRPPLRRRADGWMNLYRLGRRRGSSAVATDRGRVRVPGLAVRLLELRVPRPTARSSRSAGAAAATGCTVIAPATAPVREIDLPFTEMSGIAVDGDTVVLARRAPDRAVVDRRARPRRPARGPASARSTTARLRPRRRSRVREPVEFPTTGGRTAYGLLLPRREPRRSSGPDGELPPLIVTSHGGPTAPAFGGAHRLDPAVHEPRLRRPRRRLRRQHRLRPRLPQAARGPVGRRRRRRLRQRRALARRAGPRRRRAARDPRRQRQRLHDALRADVPRRVQGRHELLRDRRPRDVRKRDPQVRVALPDMTLIGPLPGVEAALPRALADQLRRPDLVPGPDPPGRRGPGRPAGPGRARSSTRSGRSGCPTPTCCSRARTTASGRPRTSSAAFEAELSFYGQVFGFTPADPIEPIEVDVPRAGRRGCGDRVTPILGAIEPTAVTEAECDGDGRRGHPHPAARRDGAGARSPAGSGSRTRSCSCSAGWRSGSSRACRRSSSQPELVFLLFLPPILFGAGYFTSLRDFRRNLRAITLLSVGLVIFTTVVVASWPRRSSRGWAGRPRSPSGRSSRRPTPWPRRRSSSGSASRAASSRSSRARASSTTRRRSWPTGPRSSPR